ncbi:MAG: dehydrogenase, partial [Gloeobacteraceae cyanobacterium ES-bin-316]|nr:dehydrogenase [Ferruginibacter sp.]
GINFIEFLKNGETSITPLSVSEVYKHTIEKQLVLYFTDTSRNSAAIIDEQVKNVREKNEKSIQAMHHLKEQAYLMKDIIRNGQPDELGPLLHIGFNHKKNMAANISNPAIETLYAAALNAGATGGKISGAGGGGFMVFYCPGNTREAVCKILLSFGGKVRTYSLVSEGLQCRTENIFL